MKISGRKFLLFLAIQCLVLSLFVYAGGGQQSGTSTSGKTHVELLNGKPENIKIMEQLVAKFNQENPDLDVVMTSVPDAKKVLLTRVATDDVPDIAGIFPVSMQDQIMQREGVFFDITDQPVLKLVSDTIVQQIRINNKNYALPITTNATALFYNTEIFAKYNLKVPQTAEELIQVADTLKKNGVQAFALNDKNAGSLGQQFERAIACMADQNITQTCIDVAAGRQSFTRHQGARLLAELFLKQREYGPADPMGYDTTQARAEFANGKAAMMLDGSWCAGEFMTINPNAKFSAVAPPIFPTVSRHVTAGNIDTALAISSKTPRVKESIRFLEFFARADVAQAYCEADLNPNIVKAVKYSVVPLQPINDLITKGNYIPSPSNIWDASLRSEMQIALQAFLLDKDVDAFLAKLDAMIKENYNSKK
jgi:raffinose/stachyose/melibiose transport system substrate-binding protein